MKIKVGKYVVDGEFKSRKHAKETFLTHYPLVTESDLEIELDKIYKDADKSGDAIEKDKVSDKANTEIGSKSIEGKPIRKD